MIEYMIFMWITRLCMIVRYLVMCYQTRSSWFPSASRCCSRSAEFTGIAQSPRTEVRLHSARICLGGGARYCGVSANSHAGPQSPETDWGDSWRLANSGKLAVGHFARGDCSRDKCRNSSAFLVCKEISVATPSPAAVYIELPSRDSAGSGGRRLSQQVPRQTSNGGHRSAVTEIVFDQL